MLNYLKSELYKYFNRKYLYIFVGIIFALCIGVFLLIHNQQPSATFSKFLNEAPELLVTSEFFVLFIYILYILYISDV